MLAKPVTTNARIAQLTRDNEKLKRRLENAMLVIDVQKKLAALVGITLDENGERI